MIKAFIPILQEKDAVNDRRKAARPGGLLGEKRRVKDLPLPETGQCEWEKRLGGGGSC